MISQQLTNDAKTVAQCQALPGQVQPVVVRCSACGWNGNSGQLRKTYRPTDLGPYLLCPDCSNEHLDWPELGHE
jgi:Zn finger protein HypA/HybF involved in hydrogenase expression